MLNNIGALEAEWRAPYAQMDFTPVDDHWDADPRNLISDFEVEAFSTGSSTDGITRIDIYYAFILSLWPLENSPYGSDYDGKPIGTWRSHSYVWPPHEQTMQQQWETETVIDAKYYLPFVDIDLKENYILNEFKIWYKQNHDFPQIRKGKLVTRQTYGEKWTEIYEFENTTFSDAVDYVWVTFDITNNNQIKADQLTEGRYYRIIIMETEDHILPSNIFADYDSGSIEDGETFEVELAGIKLFGAKSSEKLQVLTSFKATGNAMGDDFTITNDYLTQEASASDGMSEDTILKLIKPELEKSNTVDNAMLLNDTWGTPKSSGLIIYHTPTANDTVGNENGNYSILETLLNAYGINEMEFYGWNSIEPAMWGGPVEDTEYIIWKASEIDVSSPSSILSGGHVFSASSQGGPLVHNHTHFSNWMDSNGTDYYEYRAVSSYQAANAFNGSWSNLEDGDAWWSLDHSNTVDVIVDDNTTLHGHWVQIDIGTEVILTKFIVRASYGWAEHWHMRKAKFLTSLTGEDGSWTEIYLSLIHI